MRRTRRSDERRPRRGTTEDPAELRRSQNWIGGRLACHSAIRSASRERVGPTFAALENFFHDTDPMPPLIKAGLAHAQFETIHPFLDGNGWTGRLLITFGLGSRES